MIFLSIIESLVYPKETSLKSWYSLGNFYAKLCFTIKKYICKYTLQILFFWVT